MADGAMQTNGNGGRRPVYSNTVSLGNLLSIVMMLVAVIVAFSDLKGDVRVLVETVENNKSRLTKIENRVGLGDHPAARGTGAQ